MRLVAAALLVLLALAGCLGGGHSGAGSTSSSTPTGSGSVTATTSGPPPGPIQTLDLLLSFEFLGCQGVVLQHSRPLDQIQELLPDGFTAAPPPDSAPGTPAGMVTLELFLCDSLATPAVAVPDTYIGLESTYVQRPLDRVPQAPDAPVQEYVFRMLAGEDAVARLWPAAGYDTYNGTANVSFGPPADDPVPDVGIRDGQANVGEGYFIVASGGRVDALGGGRAQAFARYTVLDDASVLLWTGTYDIPVSAAGSGTAQLPADDPFVSFASPGVPTLGAAARFVDAGNVRTQDLRRLFT